MPTLKRCSLSGIPSLRSYSLSSRCGKSITTHISPHITTHPPVTWHLVWAFNLLQRGQSSVTAQKTEYFSIPKVSSAKTQLIYCQSVDMFRLKESSSGQLLNHVWGTSSESAHFWDPKMFTTVRERGYKWGWYLQYYMY